MFSRYSVKKPYTVVVGIVLVIILGVVTFTNLTVDLLPNMNLPYAVVMTTYPGASPEEVEMIVTKPVEQTMATVSNIKNIQSTSRDNASVVILEFEQTSNMDSITIEMRESLDQIKAYWPDGVGNPMIIKLNPTMLPVLIAGVAASDADSVATSKLIEEKVLPEIESLEGVASVTMIGSIEETIEVIVNPTKVDELSDEMKAELDSKFAEASQALADAKAQVEQGKAQLEAGQAAAASQMGQAEAEISKKAEELKQAQLEITEKKAELEVTKTALDTSVALIETQLGAAKQQLAQLNELKDHEEEMTARLQELLAVEEPTEEQQAQIADLTQKLAVLETYNLTREEIENAIKGFDRQMDGLKKQQATLDAGKSELEKMQQQINEGAISLAEARGQMASAQVQAAVGLSSGSAQLAVGEAAITQQEEQMKSAKDQAYESADMSGILNVDMVQTLLAAQNFSMPAGYVNEEGTDYLIRIGDKFKDIDEIKNLVLIDNEALGKITLSDVADVRLINNADESYARLNGEPGVILSVQKQTGYSTGDVSDRVLARLEELEQDKDLGIKTVTLMDQGVYIDLVVRSVLQNLLYGAGLAILILLIFLRSVKPTFVIALSIPISIMTALTAMYFTGITLNIISLSGLALGVGMLVDNSIVVIENIYRMQSEEGASSREAAVLGANQVAGAIAASTLTTICVFVPIVFTKGVTRQLFVDMGLTIAYSLLASLLVALTVVPMMAAGLLKNAEFKETRIMEAIKNVYGKMISGALKVKPLVLLGSLAILLLSGWLSYSRGTEFIPEMESTELSMTLQMEKGSTMEETAAVSDEILKRVSTIDDIEDIGAMIGGTSLLSNNNSNTETAQFYAITKEKPEMSNLEIKHEIERLTEDLDGELTVQTSNMDLSTLGSSGIVVRIRGKEIDELRRIAADVKEILEHVRGTANVSDGSEDGTKELRITVNKGLAMAKGLTVAQVYADLSARLQEARSTTALSTATNDIDIYVRDAKAESTTRRDIRDMTLEVTGQDGTKSEVKLSEIADFEDTTGLQSISRVNQNRTISVSAEIEEGDNVGLVSTRAKKKLDAYELPEGYEIEMAGEDQTINDAMIELLKMLGLALVFTYLIMVAQFQSLGSPFIIMFTIPLAFTGGFLGLYLTGSAISVISMIGFVMLSGIIVNNGIVFVDYTNQLIAQGMEQQEALVEAGRTRLRPIIMTALTTILGLSTMAIGVGMGADMVRPMAVVTIGGLFYGTLLTLFVVPCIYDLFHFRNRKKKGKITVKSVDERPETTDNV